MLTIKLQDNLRFPGHEDIHVHYEEIHLDSWGAFLSYELSHPCDTVPERKLNVHYIKC